MGVKAVLIVEDRPTDALLIKHALRKHYRVDHVRSPDEAKSLLQRGEYAAVVTDYYFPGADGLALQAWVAEEDLDVPVVMVSGRGDERVAAEALKFGAYDYIVKSEESLASLGTVVRQVICRHELERRAQILQQIVENASDAIITMETDGRIITANHAVETMFGFLPDEVVGRPLTLLFPDVLQGNALAPMLTSGAGGRSWQGELSAKRKDGTLVPAHMSTSVLRDKAGRALCLIGIARDITERRQLLDKLKRLSVTDNLTGLVNHRFFHDRLHYEFVRARRYGGSLACIMIDVDYFKTVNDTYGHLTGDEVLKALAQIVGNATRGVDIVARYGGEEFAVILPNTEPAGAIRCAEHIWETVGTSPIETQEGTIRLTISVGVASITPDVPDEAELHRRADTALIAAKRRGRNNVCVWDEAPLESNASALDFKGQNLDRVRANLRKLIVPAKARFLETAQPLLDALCRVHPTLRSHCANVPIYALELAKLVGMSPEEEESLHHAALFHDVGHIITPPEVLNKPDCLTGEDLRVVQGHVTASIQIMSELRLLDAEVEYVRYHHERYDGKGYPNGFVGNAIPLGARVLAVADTFDALTSERPYRKAMPEEIAMAEMCRIEGSQLDPKLVKLFLQARHLAGDMTKAGVS